jgi:hypothetical protein
MSLGSDLMKTVNKRGSPWVFTPNTHFTALHGVRARCFGLPVRIPLRGRYVTSRQLANNARRSLNSRFNDGSDQRALCLFPKDRAPTYCSNGSRKYIQGQEYEAALTEPVGQLNVNPLLAMMHLSRRPMVADRFLGRCWDRFSIGRAGDQLD